MDLRKLTQAGLILSLLGVPLLACAQTPRGNGWELECGGYDGNGVYSVVYSLDALAAGLQNSLISASIGISGTAQLGDRGNGGYCFAPSRTLNFAGRFAFQVGATGSVQSTFDDGLALTMGAPSDPVGDFCFASILKTDNTVANAVLFGDTGFGNVFSGVSHRVLTATFADADVQVALKVRVIADAIKFTWHMTNLKTTAQPLGLLWCGYTGMRTSGGTLDITGSDQADSSLFTLSAAVLRTHPRRQPYIGWTTLPTGKPVRNERKYTSANPKFPSYVNFGFAQAQPYGLRLENKPSDDTVDASNADMIILGDYSSLIYDNVLRDKVIGDITADGSMEESDTLIRDMAFIQRFGVESVGAGLSRDIIFYMRQPWSVGNYSDPYGVTIDAPKAMTPTPNGAIGFEQAEYTVRAYVDNQYDVLDKDIALRTIKFTLELPQGVDLAAGETADKTLDRINPGSIGFIDWKVIPRLTTSGTLPFKVTITPVPGPTKTLTSNVTIVPTRMLRLAAGPNLVTFPYQFADNSLDAILGLQAGIDYVAYRWNPDQFTYVPTTTVERGQSYWVVSSTDQGYLQMRNGAEAADSASGGLLTSLKQGWNMIGNPMNYPVRLAELVGVPEEAPNEALTWADLVTQGYVTSSLAYYDVEAKQYRFTSGIEAVLEPHRGYWVYVATYKPLRISWPSILMPNYLHAGRANDDAFKQTERQWRLQLSARNASGIDSQNYIGVATDAKAVKSLRSPKPPMAPNAKVELSVGDTYDGKAVRASQALIDKLTKKEWTVYVRSEEAGDVTVTWPNLASVPRNVKLKISDATTGTTKDLRVTSGYTFKMSAAGTRELKVTMETGGSAKPVIGNVLVTRPSRDRNAPFSVTYALSGDALVTVRVLSGTGREVYTITRGRADSSGQNSVTWFMRDNANRAVAPGTYRVEIMAETPGGERVRKIVPVNVVR